MSSCRRNFLNYDEFYRSIGISERIFTDDFPPPFDIGRFEATNSDALFLDAAIGAHMKGIAGDAAPRFLYALTNFNHGPHNRRLVPPGQFESERAFAAASLPDPSYAEYYARLVETAVTWNRLKSELAARFPARPTLIVHYGDHQPVMTRRIEAKLKLPVGRAAPVPHVLCHRSLELTAPIGLFPGGARTWILLFSGRSHCSRPGCRSMRFLPRAPACSSIAAKPILHRRRNGSAVSTARWSNWA